MKRALLLLSSLIVSTLLNAQTVLSPGDIAIIAYQTDNPDRFAFVSLVDISEATTITFTDNSWDGSALLTSEGSAVWTAPKGGIKKGTVIQIEGTTVTSSGIETGEATNDDFEMGNLNKWDLYTEAGNSIAIATDTVNNGTYSAKITYGGSNYIGKMSIPVDNLNSVYFRAYIWIPNNYNIGGAYTYNDIVSFYDGTQHAILCQLYSNYDGTILNWRVLADDQNSGQYYDGVTGKLGRWTRLELAWEKGSGSDSWCEVRVDGDSICGLSGFTTSGINIDSIHVGNFFYPAIFPIGYIYFDDIVVDTTDWVGPRGGVVTSNLMNLSDQGDQIFAYQGSSSSPSFIAGITSNTWLSSGTADTIFSYLPPTLTNGTTARDFGNEIDNGYFTIATNKAVKEDLLVTINDDNNWTRNDAIQTWPSWSFTVDDPLPVELSSFTVIVLESAVKLNWRTETEVSNYGFEVQRKISEDQCQQWESLGFVEGHGKRIQLYR